MCICICVPICEGAHMWLTTCVWGQSFIQMSSLIVFFNHANQNKQTKNTQCRIFCANHVILAASMLLYLELWTILLDSLRFLPWWTAVLFSSLWVWQSSKFWDEVAPDRKAVFKYYCVSDTFRKIIAHPTLYFLAKSRGEILHRNCAFLLLHTGVVHTHLFAWPRTVNIFQRQRLRINRCFQAKW